LVKLIYQCIFAWHFWVGVIDPNCRVTRIKKKIPQPTVGIFFANLSEISYSK